MVSAAGGIAFLVHSRFFARINTSIGHQAVQNFKKLEFFDKNAKLKLTERGCV